jgi:rhodanese-related sulfurtransferase
MVLILSGCTKKDQTGIHTFKNISIQEASELLQDNINNPDFVILDVRTPEEFSSGHIKGAINLDFYSATFKDELDKLIKTNIYFVYCRTGNRSVQATKLMESLGFREVYNLSPGGMPDWIEAGLPYVK